MQAISLQPEPDTCTPAVAVISATRAGLSHFMMHRHLDNCTQMPEQASLQMIKQINNMQRKPFVATPPRLCLSTPKINKRRLMHSQQYKPHKSALSQLHQTYNNKMKHHKQKSFTSTVIHVKNHYQSK
jgi:hypothetical protein